MTRYFVGMNPDTGTLAGWHKPDEPTHTFGNTMLVYFQTERTDTSTDVAVEVVRPIPDDPNGDVDVQAFTVDDSEPLDVYGPIFSRIFDELGYTLSDPGAFGWNRTENDGEVYDVEITCPFTQ